jgi:hypothetical protein
VRLARSSGEGFSFSFSKFGFGSVRFATAVLGRREKILDMIRRTNQAFQRGLMWLSLLLFTPEGVLPDPAAQADAASIIRGIDAAVQARYQNVLSFTDIEHYAVFRGKDQSHTVAEMTVKDTYTKDAGKTYTLLSESGSELVLRFGLKPLLENEREINQPANVPGSWFTSENYRMVVKPGPMVRLNGRDCIAIAVTARRKAPNMINGTIWVEANGYALAQIQGESSKSPSAFSGVTELMRQYAQIDGFPMATHARAESGSMIFGRSVVTIDYTDYHLQLRSSN